MVSVAIADKLILSPKGITDVMHKKGITKDIINTILEADKEAFQDTKKVSHEFKTLEDIWNFVHDNIRYKKDAPGDERIKYPSVTWDDRFGDCKSMSLFIGSILKNKGIPYAYRFTKYDNDSDYTHVYVVAYPKTKKIILDAVHTHYNEEVEYSAKKDYAMTQISMIQGLGSAQKAQIADLMARMDDTPKIIAPKTNILLSDDTSSTLLDILDDRLMIAAAYYGDPLGNIQQARNMVYNAQKLGSNQTFNFTGHIPSQIDFVPKYILAASRYNGSAIKKNAAINNVFEGCETVINDYRNLETEENDILNDLATGGGFEDPQSEARLEEINLLMDQLHDRYKDCSGLVRYEEILKGEFQDSACHALYERIDLNNNGAVEAAMRRSGIASTKMGFQKNAISKFAEATGINRVILSELLENGVMRSNLAQGNNPYSAFESVEMLIAAGSNPGQVPGIGFLSAAAIATIIKVITAVTAALLAAEGLVNSFKSAPTTKDYILDEITGWGGPGFAADGNDHLTNGGNTGGEGGSSGNEEKESDMSKYLPLLLGAGGLYFLTQSNKK